MAAVGWAGVHTKLFKKRGGLFVFFQKLSGRGKLSQDAWQKSCVDSAPRKITSTKRLSPAISMKSTPAHAMARAISLPEETKNKNDSFVENKNKKSLIPSCWVRVPRYTEDVHAHGMHLYALFAGLRHGLQKSIPWSSTLKKLCTFACQEDPESCVFNCDPSGLLLSSAWVISRFSGPRSS
jgi:hypothetical protein